jgi:hypothetical protein
MVTDMKDVARQPQGDRRRAQPSVGRLQERDWLPVVRLGVWSPASSRRVTPQDDHHQDYKAKDRD